jgi:hypothetical protein
MLFRLMARLFSKGVLLLLGLLNNRPLAAVMILDLRSQAGKWCGVFTCLAYSCSRQL